jgi:DNA-binding CsgD family transcriptional regulator
MLGEGFGTEMFIGSNRNLALSQREEEILLLASRGLTDRQISAELGIRAGTINTHWSRIRLKLGAATRSEAVSILLKEKAMATQQALEQEKEALLSEVSHRQQIEMELRSSRQLLQVVLSNAPIIIWVMDRDGTVEAVEGKALSMLGLRPTTGLEKRAAAVKALVSDKSLKRALDGEEIAEEVSAEDNRFDVRISPIFDSRRKVISLNCVALDVTGRK